MAPIDCQASSNRYAPEIAQNESLGQFGPRSAEAPLPRAKPNGMDHDDADAPERARGEYDESADGQLQGEPHGSSEAPEMVTEEGPLKFLGGAEAQRLVRAGLNQGHGLGG